VHHNVSTGLFTAASTHVDGCSTAARGILSKNLHIGRISGGGITGGELDASSRSVWSRVRRRKLYAATVPEFTLAAANKNASARVLYSIATGDIN